MPHRPNTRTSKHTSTWRYGNKARFQSTKKSIWNYYKSEERKKREGPPMAAAALRWKRKRTAKEKRFGLRFSGTAWKISKAFHHQHLYFILKVFHPTAVPPHFLSSKREAVELVVALIFLFSILFLFLLGHFYEPVPPTHFHPTTFYLKVSNLFSSPLKWIEDEKKKKNE